MISASATVGFSNVALARADDGGSSSDSGSGSESGSSIGGSSSDNSDSGGSNNKGSNDNGNNNNDNDKKINDPLNPKKEDTKDISDIPEENGSHCLTNECPTKTKTKNPEPVARCDSIGCNPADQPQQAPKSEPPTVTQIVNIDIILKTIHKGHGTHSNSSPAHGLSDACYVALKQAWSGQIHVGQNAELDQFMARCLA